MTSQDTAAATLDPEIVGDDVAHALGHSWFFDPHTITVSIISGVVTLAGTVRSDRERRMAAAAAWAEVGVKDVVNSLVVV